MSPAHGAAAPRPRPMARTSRGNQLLYQLLRSWNPVLNAVYVLCLLRNAVYLLCLLRIDFPGIASKASISWPDMLALLAAHRLSWHSKQSNHIATRYACYARASSLPRAPARTVPEHIGRARGMVGWLVGWLAGDCAVRTHPTRRRKIGPSPGRYASFFFFLLALVC